MINKLYSILVSGVHNIPEDFPMWRKYTEMSKVSALIPIYSDPYRRSLWANALIELSKYSKIYPEIEKLDPQNTYRTSPVCIARHTVSDGISVIKLSDDYPVLDINIDVSGDSAMYSYNGGSPMICNLGDDRRIEVNGFILQIDKDKASAYITNPSVALNVPDKKSISRIFSDLNDINSEVDIDHPWDRAALFCIYLLRLYDGR